MYFCLVFPCFITVKMPQSRVKPNIGLVNGHNEFIDGMLCVILGKKRFTE